MRISVVVLTALASLVATSTLAQSSSAPLATDAPGARAPAAEAALSNRSLQLRYFTSAKSVGMPDGELSGGVFLSEDRDLILSATLLVPADLNFGRRVSFRFGPRAYIGFLSDKVLPSSSARADAAAIAAGATVRLEILQRQDLAAVGSAYYSPEILTFGSAHDVRDLEARLEMRLTRHAVIFGGWRWLKMNVPGSDRSSIQDDFIAGVRWRLE